MVTSYIAAVQNHNQESYTGYNPTALQIYAFIKIQTDLYTYVCLVLSNFITYVDLCDA